MFYDLSINSMFFNCRCDITANLSVSLSKFSISSNKFYLFIYLFNKSFSHGRIFLAIYLKQLITET